MIESVLQEILETENKAEEIKSEAEKKAESVRAQADKTKREMIEEAGKNMRAYKDNVLRSATIEEEKSYADYMQGVSDRCEKLKAERFKTVQELADEIFGGIKNGDL